MRSSKHPGGGAIQPGAPRPASFRCLLQLGVQRRHRPCGMAPDSTGADPGGRGDLGFRQASVVPQHQDLALPGGQCPQRGEDRGALEQRGLLLGSARDAACDSLREPVRNGVSLQRRTAAIEHRPAQKGQGAVAVRQRPRGGHVPRRRTSPGRSHLRRRPHQPAQPPAAPGSSSTCRRARSTCGRNTGQRWFPGSRRPCPRVAERSLRHAPLPRPSCPHPPESRQAIPARTRQGRLRGAARARDRSTPFGAAAAGDQTTHTRGPAHAAAAPGLTILERGLRV